MHAAWAEARRVSRELKIEHIEKNEQYRRRWASRAAPLNVNGISVGDRVLVRHGDHQNAARLRKHGEQHPFGSKHKASVMVSTGAFCTFFQKIGT